MSEQTSQSKKVVLLDLDGTLTKSDPGIIGCVVKVFEELGYPVLDDEELQRFIGPAIIESLRRNDIPEDRLDEGIAIYRRYYADEAVFDDPNNPGQKVPGRLNNTIYDGIPEQLAKLRADGYYLAIASCKPQYHRLSTSIYYTHISVICKSACRAFSGRTVSRNIPQRPAQVRLQYQ